MAHVTGGSKSISVGYDDWENPVANGALARFDATNPQALLETSGIVTFNSGAINEEIPSSGGLRGFRFRYTGNTDPTGDANNERRYLITTPQSHTYEHIKLWQPSNFEHRHYFQFITVELEASASNWQVGDTVTAAGSNTGVIADIKTSGTKAQIFLEDNTAADFTMLPDGATVTNNRNSETLTVASAGFVGGNNKFSAQWVDDGDANQGYSNGGMIVEYTTNWDTTPKSSIKMDVNSSNSHANTGSKANELTNDNIMIDTFDNGSVVEYVIERERSSADGVSDAVYRLWKKTSKVGSAYLNWTLIFQNTSLLAYDTFQGNKFSNGYFLGYANSGFTNQTDVHLMEWELWDTKPQVLIDAGV